VALALVAATVPVILTGLGQLWWGWHGPFQALGGLVIWHLKPGGNPPGRLAGLFDYANIAGSWLALAWPLLLAALLQPRLDPRRRALVLLLAAGLAPPQRVFAHGWWTIEGQKMSKSLGNAIDPVKLGEEFGLDAVRFFLLREVPFGQDGDFSRRALIQRLNSELADSLGNLANRTLSLIQRNCEARLPEPGAPDALWAEHIATLPTTVGNHLELQQFHAALEAIFATIRAANVHITEQAPWALKKTDPARGVAVLRGLHDALRVIATLLTPFMPTTMAAMLDQLGVPEDARNLAALATPLPGGLALPPPAPLFRKLDLPA
jgi:methionyl-tRNA synthetase